MDMNDVNLQREVLTYDVLCISETFFFHDELCVNLRKYKEIIRKYVSESELPSKKRSTNVPSYIRNLLSNFNNLIGVSGNQSIPKPAKPRHSHEVNKGFTSFLNHSSSNMVRKLSKGASTNDEEEQKTPVDEKELRLIQQQRQIACILLNRERNVCSHSSFSL